MASVRLELKGGIVLQSFKATYGIGTRKLEENVLYALYEAGGTSTRKAVIEFLSGYIDETGLDGNMGQQVQVRINDARKLGWVFPANESERGVWTLTPAGHAECRSRFEGAPNETAVPKGGPKVEGIAAKLHDEAAAAATIDRQVEAREHRDSNLASPGPADPPTNGDREANTGAKEGNTYAKAVAVFQEQDDDYRAWLEVNPDGFVASYEKPAGAYARLHRANCNSLRNMPVGSKSQTKQYFKYCAAAIENIDAAAIAAGLPVAQECGSRTCKPRSTNGESVDSKRNPAWRREELILALHHYFTEPKIDHRQESPKIEVLCQVLNSLPYHTSKGETFHTPASCEMMLSNFRSLDPDENGVELSSVAKADQAIWEEFVGDRAGLAREAERVRVDGTALPEASDEPDLDQEQYSEGQLYYRMHRGRERSQGLPEKAKQRFRKLHGRLFCEVCGFDFAKTYGSMGDGFIEAHHTKPVSQIAPGEKTKLADLAMVCSNCHRMLHVGKGLTVKALKEHLGERA